jgi:hypothetical protein
VTFDVAHQRLVAMLRDALGGTAQLVHPFHTRGREGFNVLLGTLEKRGGLVRFICGHVRSTGRALEIRPVSVIIEDGDRRFGIQPWVSHEIAATDVSDTLTEKAAGEPPVADQFLGQLQESLADLLLTGVAACDVKRWVEQSENGRQLGFTRLASPIASLSEALNARTNVVRWNDAPAVKHARELCLLSRIAME